MYFYSARLHGKRVRLEVGHCWVNVLIPVRPSSETSRAHPQQLFATQNLGRALSYARCEYRRYLTKGTLKSPTLPAFVGLCMGLNSKRVTSSPTLTSVPLRSRQRENEPRQGPNREAAGGLCRSRLGHVIWTLGMLFVKSPVRE